jgi:hypothetical protein
MVARAKAKQEKSSGPPSTGARRHLVVLESPWDDESGNIASYSMRPFVEGLCELHDFRLIYRTFTTPTELTALLGGDAFDSHVGRWLVYIASHGYGGRLAAGRGAQRGINLGSAAKALRRSVEGVWVGACEAGSGALRGFLDRGGSYWAGGYTCSVDWSHSMLIDLAILQSTMSATRSLQTRQRQVVAFRDALHRFDPAHVIGEGSNEVEMTLRASLRVVARDHGKRAKDISDSILRALKWTE